MAKPLLLRLDGREVPFDLGSKVEKKHLYGHARRIAERDGKAMTRGHLAGDGRLFGSGALGYLKVDPEGSPIEETQQWMDGEPAPVVASSFDSGLELEPVALSALTEFAVRDVYPLIGSGIEPGLYRSSFNYRKSNQANEALLLVRPDQVFLLVGQARQTTWLGLSVAYEFFDAEAEAEDDADELDFSMI
jgi:hypothetical protein